LDGGATANLGVVRVRGDHEDALGNFLDGGFWSLGHAFLTFVK